MSAKGSFGRGGRAEAVLPSDGAAVTVEVHLAPSGTVTGTFYKADGKTPIAGGQIKLKHSGQAIAYAVTSSDPATLGQFRMEYVPLGDFSLEGYDPTTERVGRGAGRLASDGEAVAADVTVIPRGTVRGTVLNYGGTAPIDKASVHISAPGYAYSATTGSDGTFVFAGVPSGSFNLDAVDPGNGLQGRTSGSITYEGETASTEVHIAPTGGIEGRVLLPDGVTPAVNARVTFKGKSVLVDPATGGFAFDNLALGSYSIAAYELNTHRAVKTIATLSADGDVAHTDLVLQGVGNVSGTVFDTDGITPLAGATVRLQASGATCADYTVYSDTDGAFRFTDVPVGTFSLNVSHPQRVTAASASGTLSAEGAEAKINLIIGPVASVTGTVLRPGAVTPAAGGGVKFTGCGSTFNSMIDSQGHFLFANIPVPCKFSLNIEDADGIGIGKASGSLTVNGELYDIGTVVLDAQPIAVREVDPAPGTVNVPVVSKVHILFSESARLDTVNSTTIKLLKGTKQVAGSLQLDVDGAGVTFTPDSPLQGFALYTVVVTTGLRDRVDRPLVQTWSSTFTTVDNVPPTVTAVSPTNAAIQVTPDAVVRLTFSEAIDPAALAGIRLLKGGSPVDARLDLLQGGMVAALTPLSPLATNDFYSVSVSGVRDTVGNVQTGTYTASFSTLDTIAPTVGSLSVPTSARLIQGLSVAVTATVADSDVARVDFFAEDVLVATDGSAPYTFSLPPAREGTLQLKAIAQDKVGNRGAATLLSLEVAPDQPPSAAILQPDEGALVGTGGQFTVRVQGSDDIGVKEATLTATGAMSVSQTKTLSGNPATADFTLSVPAGAAPGSAIVLAASIKDSGDQRSATVQRSVTVKDSLAPTLTLASPGQTVLYKPGETGVATVSSSDNIGVSALTCTASSAATGSQDFAFDPAAKQQTQQFTFSIFDNAAPHAQATITCSARDAAGNSGQKVITLETADVVPPQVRTASIADGATDVPIGSTFSVTFDEPLAADTVNGSSVVLSASGQTQALAGAISLSADGRTVSFVPAAPLQRGTQYQLSLSTALTDVAGNPLAAAYLLNFTADDTPPAIKSVSPAADSQNAPVGSAVAVTFTEAIDPASVAQDTLSLSSSFGPVAGTISISADRTTILLKPLGQLSFNRAYTLTLKAGIRDISGNVLASGDVFTFKTKAPGFGPGGSVDHGWRLERFLREWFEGPTDQWPSLQIR